MLYYADENVRIRTIREADAKALCEEEIKQGWQQTEEKYWTRIRDNASGKAVALVAEYDNQAAGYISVYLPSDGAEGQACCEIIDFAVLEKYRNRGIGGKLMDVAERIAAGYADVVTLGVGLHSGYGSAQRMYAKRGYIPDGKGVWYGKDICAPYETYRNDDDLNLRLSKQLRPLSKGNNSAGRVDRADAP